MNITSEVKGCKVNDAGFKTANVKYINKVYPTCM